MTFNLKFSKLELVAITIILVLDVLSGIFLIKNPVLAKISLYLLFNAFFASWIYIAMKGKTPLAISYIIILVIAGSSVFLLDKLSTWVLVDGGAEDKLLFSLKLVLGLIVFSSAILTFKGLRILHAKVRSLVFAFFLAGVSLSLTLVWPPLGITVLIVGLLFQRKRSLSIGLIAAIWLTYLLEFASYHLNFSFPHVYEGIKRILSMPPAFIYYMLWLQLLCVTIPIVWRKLWENKDKFERGWLLFSESRMGKIGLVLVLSMVLMGIFAPYIAPYPYDQWSDEMNSPPSSRHLLGTNHYGQDILSRVIWGSRISLIVGFTAAGLSVLIGTAIGMISGFYGGIIDTILMRITDVFISIPTLPLMLVFVSIFGKGLGNIILALSLLGWTGTARTVRSQTLSLKERPLTEAARAIGASDSQILIRHMLPNLLPLILATMIIRIVDAILSEAGLSFLGFGVPFGPPSWGIILHFADRKGAITRGLWWWFLPPGVMIMLLVLGFAFMSHAIDQIINPRLRRRRK